MSSSIRVIDLLKATDDIMSKALIMAVNENPLLSAMPVIETNKIDYRIQRMVDLPDVGSRLYNDTYTASSGTFDEKVINLTPFGGTVRVDRKLLNASPKEIERQIQAKIRAISNEMANVFINGDGIKKGIKELIDDEYNDAEVSAKTMKIKLNDADAGYQVNDEASYKIFFQYLREAADEVSDTAGVQKVFVMGKDMKKLFMKASSELRENVLTATEFYGRPTLMFYGIPILLAGLDANNSQIMQFNENSPDGSSNTDCGSIYVLALDEIEETAIAMDGAPSVSKIDKGEYIDYVLDVLFAPITHKPNSAVRLYGIRQ